MSDKQGTPFGQLWMAGFGSAMQASKLVLDGVAQMNRAALMGGPFAMTNLMKVSAFGPVGVDPKAKDPEAGEAEATPTAAEAVQAIFEAPVQAAEGVAQSIAPLAAEADAMLEALPDTAEAEPEAEATPDEFVGEILAEPAEPEVEEEPVVEAGPVLEAEPVEEPELATEPVSGDRPTALAAARDGAADDLTLIKGVGPKLAALLNSHGYFHFDQIAAWGEAELAWVDANLQGFTGRATRDDWIGQARQLAGPAPEDERLI